MLLGYNRLLVYIFLKIAPLDHGKNPISLCANFYLPENSQPMFLIASMNQMKQVNIMEMNWKEHLGTKQRKFRR